MIFIVYATLNSASISDKVGLSEYSYYFVLKAYLPMLEKLGKVVAVDAVDHRIDEIYARAVSRGRDCVFLSFTAPHNTATHFRCPTLSVFAWEYSEIPSESWSENPMDNWVFALTQLGGAITHSSYTVKSVQNALGLQFPVVSVPAPLWEEFNKLSQGTIGRDCQTSLELRASVFDSALIDSESLIDQRGGINFDAFINDEPVTVNLEGVVYTSVFNPNDGRKNWEDMVSAFCYSFRDNANVTLLLKLTYHDAREAFEEILEFLKRLLPFQCRVLIVHGFIDDVAYKNLIMRTDYVVNTALGEGQCLPLMEYMSAGKPAVSPCHSAMIDYISCDNAFVVESFAEWTHWPHDPRFVHRTLRYRVNWQSVCDAYRESYDVADAQPDVYKRMSTNAIRSQFDYCSIQNVSAALTQFLSRPPYRRPVLKKLVAATKELAKMIVKSVLVAIGRRES